MVLLCWLFQACHKIEAFRVLILFLKGLCPKQYERVQNYGKTSIDKLILNFISQHNS